MSLAPLRLKKNEDRRLRAGHVWIFSNEVDVAATPLTAFTPGDAVQIEAANGHVLGSGYVNPRSLICARLVSRDSKYQLDRSLIIHRLNVALSLRTRLYAQPFYRLVFGEADALPGLVVDRYGDVCVAQITTAGMERVKDDIVAALLKVVRPTAILWRNDSGAREPEGLPRYIEPAHGDVPEFARIEENGVRFDVPLAAGQKTGWFFDQARNRTRMRAYVKDMRVLDVFSYIGGWGVQAMAAGARETVCIDGSAQASEWVARNAALNEVNVAVTIADAFDALRALRAAREKFDVVLVDPPAFIKRKKDARAGIEAYRRINEMALQVTATDGILISSSCSHHLPAENLLTQLLQASRHLDRSLQVIETGAQAPDHPLHPAIPETQYLKSYFCRVLPA